MDDKVREVLGRNKFRNKDTTRVGKTAKKIKISRSTVFFTTDREVGPDLSPDDTRVALYCFGGTLRNCARGRLPYFD